MWNDKCPQDMSMWKTKSALEFFLHHSAESKVLFGQNAQLVKSAKLRFARFRNQVTRKTIDQATTKLKSELQSHTFMWSMDKNRGWKAAGLFGQIGDKMTLSLSKKSLYHSYKNDLCTRSWYHLFLLKGFIPYVVKLWTVSWKTAQKIACVTFFSHKSTLIGSLVSMLMMM